MNDDNELLLVLLPYLGLLVAFAIIGAGDWIARQISFRRPRNLETDQRRERRHGIGRNR